MSVRPGANPDGVPYRFQLARRSALADALRRRRLDRRLGLDELGGLIGVSGAYVAAVEEHELMPTVDTLFAFADALRVAPADLLREAEDGAERLLLRDLRDRVSSPPS